MKRLLRGSLAVLAGLALTTAALPSGPAYADHIMTLCDNIDPGTTVYHDEVAIPFGLGVVEIHLTTSQDTYVSYDGPGTPLDTLVGADLGTISLAEPVAVCLRAPVVGNWHVMVDVIGLQVRVCAWQGEPGHGGTWESNCVVNT